MNEYKQQVAARAESDTEFRALLLRDPNAAIEDELGLSVPASITVRVVEESLTEVVLVLPAATSEALDDDDLAAVAGGGTHSWCGGEGRSTSTGPV